MGKKIILVIAIIIIIILVWYYLIRPKTSNVINKSSLVSINPGLVVSPSTPQHRG